MSKNEENKSEVSGTDSKVPDEDSELDQDLMNEIVPDSVNLSSVISKELLKSPKSKAKKLEKEIKIDEADENDEVTPLDDEIEKEWQEIEQNIT